MSVKPIPAGYHTVTPYLIVSDAAGAIDFYRRAFDAQETMRLQMPSGNIGHAELKIGDSTIMLADEFPEMQARSPLSYGGTPVSLLLYVDDVDARFQQATAAGGKEMRAVQDQFYGDRSGIVADPYGHVWTIATHKEDLSPEEVHRRFEALVVQPGESP
jgi:PhnB protein